MKQSSAATFVARRVRAPDRQRTISYSRTDLLRRQAPTPLGCQDLQPDVLETGTLAVESQTWLRQRAKPPLCPLFPLHNFATPAKYRLESPPTSSPPLQSLQQPAPQSAVQQPRLRVSTTVQSEKRKLACRESSLPRRATRAPFQAKSLPMPDALLLRHLQSIPARLHEVFGCPTAPPRTTAPSLAES